MSRILAIDYGRSRIGIAVSDPLGITAQSQPTLSIKGKKDALEKLAEIIDKFTPFRIVLGLPLNQIGEMGDMAKEVREFGDLINGKFSVPVDYFDERFTSRQAKQTMRELGEKPSKNKGRVDSLSAVFILQGYLELSSSRFPE